jgi:hypothetical protein
VQGQDHGLKPFTAGHHAIFDDFAEVGEVVIWSRSPYPPRLGDRFNIEAAGQLRDLAVVDARVFTGGWTAICRADIG